jgi:hypothetical protein
MRVTSSAREGTTPGKRRNRPFEVLELEFRISNETNPGAQSLLINEWLKEWHELDTRGVVALKTLERDPAS